ncbi:hypothetical protein BD560DRAFT_429049 [Blakeslea trispora]|nr:hypothetical protein BD560DRAFT_429049 [Blakeslea trispora]
MTMLGREGLVEVVYAVLFLLLYLGGVFHLLSFLYPFNSAHIYQTDKNPQNTILDFSILVNYLSENFKEMKIYHILTLQLIYILSEIIWSGPALSLGRSITASIWFEPALLIDIPIA